MRPLWAAWRTMLKGREARSPLAIESTERRVIFSPEVEGRRIGSARPEWQVMGEAVARAFPERAAHVRFASAAAIREEIARAIPLYAGIERLATKGDQFQWGGPTLYADGRFATADGRAHFAPLDVTRPAHAAVMERRRCRNSPHARPTRSPAKKYANHGKTGCV